VADNNILDVAIIGSGPAAFTAAIYAARENLSVTVFERDSIGGLTGTISKIENFPGFSGTGAELMQFMRDQAESFGAKTEYGECTAISVIANKKPVIATSPATTSSPVIASEAKQSSPLFELTIDEEPILAKTVIIATGSERRKLGIPGEDLPGVSYCATCDGPLAADKKVIVIGGGNSAVQESFFLLKYAPKVTILARSALRCNDVLKDRLAAEPRITVVTGAEPLEFTAKDGKLTGVKCRLKKDDTTKVFSANFAFVLAGMVPATSFLPPNILSEDGSVKTKHDFSTLVPGLFAAGDCRHDNIKQAIVAAGEGASAAVAAGKYLAESSKA
jgi:thioredoxin reductase (NADPH)